MQVNLNGTSSKLYNVVKVVEEILERREKMIIFTQFLGIIECLSQNFKLKDLKYESIDGSMKPE